MSNKNGHKVRTVKKIRYVRKGKRARNNLNAQARKLIYTEINGDY